MKRKLGSAIAIVIRLMSIMIKVEAIDNEEEILKQLNAQIDENLIYLCDICLQEINRNIVDYLASKYI